MPKNTSARGPAEISEAVRDWRRFAAFVVAFEELIFVATLAVDSAEPGNCCETSPRQGVLLSFSS